MVIDKTFANMILMFVCFQIVQLAKRYRASEEKLHINFYFSSPNPSAMSAVFSMTQQNNLKGYMKVRTLNLFLKCLFGCGIFLIVGQN